MSLSNISIQLQNDYPDCEISLEADSRMIIVDKHKMSLMLTPSGLKSINIFSRSGRTFYQTLVQLIFTNYGILPSEGSYADTLIIRQEDLNKFKIQKLAREWGIGFIENGGDIVAVNVDDGINRNLLLESEDLLDEENFPEETKFVKEDYGNFGVLEELDETPDVKESSEDNKKFIVLEELESVEDEITEKPKSVYKKFVKLIQRAFKINKGDI
jgi:hypothetical protein